MSQYLRDFARHLVDEREGMPVAISTVTTVFVNRGNAIPGDPEAQRYVVRTLLCEDEGLAYDPDTDAIDTPNEGESKEDFEARRQKGLIHKQAGNKP